MNNIRCTDDDHATALHSLALHVDLFFCDRDVEGLRLPENSDANIVFIFAGVSV